MRHRGQAGEQVADWGINHYETTAEQLFPAARAVVENAAIRPGERVLDLGCGTGNAAVTVRTVQGEARDEA